MNSLLPSSKKLLLPLLSAVVLLASVCAAHAQVLLDVQISDSGVVTITSTGNVPITDVPLADNDHFGEGIDLLNFFQQDVGQGPSGFAELGDTLTTGDGSATTGGYNAFASDGYTTSNVSDYDLDIYSAVGGMGIPVGATGTETFSTTSPAFTGTLTFDASGLSLPAGSLPTGTLTGNIIAGYSGGGSDTVIGQWQVVNAISAPEPASWILLGTGILALALIRLRRHRAERIARP